MKIGYSREQALQRLWTAQLPAARSRLPHDARCGMSGSGTKLAVMVSGAGVEHAHVRRKLGLMQHLPTGDAVILVREPAFILVREPAFIPYVSFVGGLPSSAYCVQADLCPERFPPGPES